MAWQDKIKDIFKTGKAKSKYPELTPEKEMEIRTDERINFAASFNFQSLFVNEDAGGDWKSWLGVIGALLTLIVLFKVW